VPRPSTVPARSERAREIGERIKQRRERVGITQSELSERTGISLSIISRIELGQVTHKIEQLESIATVLDIAVGRFLIQDTAKAS
jgi:XRE family transcriptional regulator of biofilm formation